jgi:hypothetical protein
MSSPSEVGRLTGLALDAMRSTGPSPLLLRVEMEARLAGLHLTSPAELLLEELSGPVGDNALAARLRTELAQWDADGVSDWAVGTSPKTDERRTRAYGLLGLPEALQERLSELFPVASEGGGVVVSEAFEPWYAESRNDRPPYYWEHYRDYLLAKNWTPEAVADLSLATDRVIERLADPERDEAYQSKGLVVGYVQSGKTANFTGVIAKAIDAGYRLIIVLTGTTDLLRDQTQRRIDKELVGKENLMRGVNRDDPDSLAGVDYYGEPDWDAFVAHGLLPSEIGKPDIYRLTTRDGDYRALKQGIEALDFQRFDTAKPLNAPENLRRLPARIAIIKKNATVLRRLVTDLKKITAKLEDIPTIVIDDESDQASVNTSNPAKWQAGQKERTAINGHISALLRMLPRGQYVGYTATPFANVFVDPSDAEDIFPSKFIVSLDRPPDYMGAIDFHDLDGLADDATLASSNELAYVRHISDADDDRESLREAIDAFVLTGAIKLYRNALGGKVDPTHHTMLVHESVRNVDQRELANEVRALWASSSWYTPKAAHRLRELYDRDFLPVMLARSKDEPVPTKFEDVAKFIGAAADKIAGPENDPVWIVNGDKEVAQHNIDFGARSIWKIFVGGTKLSRGFTIEGLTISYYRRSTYQADTLMQMGRWFGFRPGYRDLVRLYVGRTSPGARNGYDIYLAFEAACRSEEMFRAEVKKYSEMIDGKPQLTPSDVPPLVAQHVPWLKPAAPNKMYNAQLVERRSPGARLEPSGYPSSAADVAHNARVLRPILEAADTAVAFEMPSGRRFDAYYGIVPHSTLVTALRQLRWAPGDHFAADLRWLEGLSPAQITDWVIALPQLSGDAQTRGLFGLRRSVHERSRRDGRVLFSGIADPKHRLAADRIAGNEPAGSDSEAKALRSEKRGGLLIYPVFETTDGRVLPEKVDADQLVMGLVIASPRSTGSPDQPLVRFTTIDPTRPSQAIIDRQQ